MPSPYDIFWGSTWGNNMAAVEWFLAVAILGALLRKPIKRLTVWARRQWTRELREHLDRIDATAQAAHKIAADTYKAQTGETHPEALKGQ